MTRAQILPDVQAAIAAALPTITVVNNDFGTAASAAMESALRSTGYVIALRPILGSKLIAQKGVRIIEDVTLCAHVRWNPTKAPSFACAATIDAILVCVSTQTLGGKVGHGDGRVTELIADDAGLQTTAVYFTCVANNS